MTALPGLEGLLAQVNTAVANGDRAQALRFADAAARRAPKSPELHQLLGRTALQAGQPNPAAEAFTRALALRGGPDGECDLIDALLAADRADEAVQRTRAALARFAVNRGDRLARTARRAVEAATEDFAGWIGVSTRLELWGEVRESAASGGEAAPAKVWRRFRGGPTAGSQGSIDIAFEGRAVLGAGAPFPPAFGLDGRGRVENGQITGWVRLDWAPAVTPHLRLRNEAGLEIAATVEADPTTAGRYRFWAARPDAVEVTVSVVTPDGAEHPLADSPILLRPLPAPQPARPAFGPPARLRRPSPGRGQTQIVDVVVPVYKGLDETLACIASVGETAGQAVEIVVIDDATPDPSLALALDDLARDGRVTLLRNGRNLGFPGAVNRGLALHPRRDVVVLNADAQVFPGWLERLRAGAYSAKDIGTVTALTNCGSIASYPAGETDCSQAEAAEIASLTASLNQGVLVEAPTGVGFCLYIRRDCLNDTGLLDETTFGAGYGEENDFCLRAAANGWRHLIAPEVFVRHLGGRSFGARREALLERNLPILNDRHPGYEDRIAAYQAADPLTPARRTLDEARLKLTPAERVLLVSLNLDGGVERHVRQHADHWIAEGAQVLILRPSPSKAGVCIEVAADARFESLVYDGADDLAAMSRFLRELQPSAIEFHHFLDWPAAAIEAVLEVGAPYEVFVHDYSWICTRITLLDDTATYCGEPSLAACAACALGEGARLGEGLTIEALRERSGKWLFGARAVIVPSQDVRTRLARYFPDLPITVRPWEAELAAPMAPTARRDGPTRVALIGAIGEHKGFAVLRACAQDAAARDLDLEFVVIGYSEDDDALTATGKVFVTGRYQEPEIQALIQREAPDVALFASVWPETWCYALTHALEAALPVLSFDIGAIAERLRGQAGDHQMLPLGAQPKDINDRLLEMAAGRPAGQPAAVHEIIPEPEALQPPAPPLSFSTFKSEDADTPMDESKSALKVSVEVLSLTKGIYQFAVRSATPRRVGDDGELTLPAVHVGLGPGMAQHQIELLTGLRSDGAWLYEPRDMIIMKVKASPTLVLLTSARAEGMDALEISVERLDAPRKALPPAQPAMPALAAPTLALPPASPAIRPAAHLEARGVKPVEDALRLQIMAHVSNQGDQTYVDAFWAGAMGEGLPIEGFVVQPLEGVRPEDLQYKALSASGIETPWVGGGELCGSRGIGDPLIGFAVRLRESSKDEFECEYRGAFRSGKCVGPITNGAPCKSSNPDDPLEGIQLTIVRRRKPIKFVAPEEAAPPEPARAWAAGGRRIGPRFSVFREETH